MADPTTIESIDDLLSTCGVDLGRPERRRARASRLLNEGATMADLQLLSEWAHASRRKIHTVGAWMSWATRSNEQWRALVADITKVREKHREVAPGDTGERNVMRPVEPSPDEQRRRQRGLAYARVRGDHIDPATVAVELGITIDELNALVDEEARSRDPNPAPPPWAKDLKPPGGRRKAKPKS